MQDGYRILGSGKSGKMAKIYQHHKFPPCLGFPSMGKGRGESYTLFRTLPGFEESYLQKVVQRLVGSDCSAHELQI